MAKLTLSLLLLFYLIAFSEPLATSDLPAGDVAGRDLPGGSEAEPTATILLPSEKPRSEAATVVPIDTETSTVAPDSTAQDAADVAVAEDRPSSEPEKIASVPLRTVVFRPYDHGGFRERAVPLSLRFPYRHGGRGCRHGRGQFRPRFEGGEISFGNDMILSGEEPGSDPESRGIERQMPGRWIRVHHRKPRFGYLDAAWKEDKDMMKRPHRHEERGTDDEREHHRRWKEDKDMMKRSDRHEEREDDEDREHHHRRWKEDKDMMKRPHGPEEREDDEDRERHHHRRWKEGMDTMKRPHRPEEREDDEEREHHHHHHHHHHFGIHRDHEGEERHGGEGIFKRIRKFLHHF
ncbi:hypothetical protein NL676_011133 [Syzygium grande]|nr:hypothetical protein NL676_011133 [Syzygium grande]